MIVAFFAAWAAAIGLAWTLALRRPEHRPVALLLMVGLAAELLGFVVANPLARNALALVWPVGIVAAALAVYARKAPWAAVAGGLAVLALLAFGPRLVGAHGEPIVLTAVQVASSALAAALGIIWFRDAWRTRQAPSSAHFALTAIVVAEVVALFGSWRLGPAQNWSLSQSAYLTMFAILAVVQGRSLCSPQLSMSRSC